MLFPEILGKEGSCCVSCRPASHFEAIVNLLGSASISSVITEVVTGFVSESQWYSHPHLRGAACEVKSLSFNALKSFAVRQHGTLH